MFKNVLIANRGEIAVRIMRTCKDLGIATTAVFSEADRESPHVRQADTSIYLGPAPARHSYLVIEKLIAAAREAGADAIHPGYGLLSENPDFARAVVDAGISFIGPSSEAIALMGDKVRARAIAQSCGIPIVPGSDGTVSGEGARKVARQLGFPIIAKAAAGGGGRGVRVVRDEASLDEALASATREAEASFGRGDMFLEKLIERARHVEVQIFGDMHGRVIHLGDRDCSLQRRYQKLVEEAPAPNLAPELRAALHAASVRIACEIGYVGAGTVEFLVDADGSSFHFLEVNTRLQVEHGVSELLTGLDLVEWQLRVAAGEALPLSQDEVRTNGHAIQVRVAAEDPTTGFRPSTGTIKRLQLPAGPWVRADFGVDTGGEVTPYYDSMIGKVMAWGLSRESARQRVLRALSELRVEGVRTSSMHLAALIGTKTFASVAHDIGWLERETAMSVADDLQSATLEEQTPPGLVVDPFVQSVFNTPQGMIHVDRFVRRKIEREVAEAVAPRQAVNGSVSRTPKGEPVAPIDCTIVQIRVAVGDHVEVGMVLCIVEAMKMELHVVAECSGIVSRLLVAEGASVKTNTLLIDLS